MNIEEKKDMGLRIKTERENLGYSQDVLADKLGMKRANISNYEAGRVVPPGNVLKEMSQIFNVDSDYLLGLSDVKRTVIKEVVSESFPEWATPKDKRDFKKLLESDGELMFDGVPLDDEDKQRINDVLTGLFWEAKHMNKEARRKAKEKRETN